MKVKSLGFFVFIIFLSGCVSGNNLSVDAKITFAKCLTEQNVTMYGASWCSHCNNQKEMFGDAFQYVNYVECTEDTIACESAGVRGYPTWVVGGQLHEGEQSFSTLSKMTGCKL